ncbi:hypothetical protein CgunFtcFv8_013713 [Champsocephalus gunnari]|uniref:Uncharacterized protein n=1 Tax=Champsocephalus gunnari TaxID=52237 RepID=A0AAN8DZV6_CHAGU|nr:hypothetical protein CgunFtcFv8_013713 [Champsocephalus gunnari]
MKRSASTYDITRNLKPTFSAALPGHTFAPLSPTSPEALCASLRGSQTLQSCPNYSSERRISQTLRLLRTPSQACFWSSGDSLHSLGFPLYMTE